jgi:hypothetical protein
MRPPEISDLYFIVAKRSFPNANGGDRARWLPDARLTSSNVRDTIRQHAGIPLRVAPANSIEPAPSTMGSHSGIFVVWGIVRIF